MLTGMIHQQSETIMLVNLLYSVQCTWH